MHAPLAPFAPRVCAAFQPLHSRGWIALVAIGDLGPWLRTLSWQWGRWSRSAHLRREGKI